LIAVTLTTILLFALTPQAVSKVLPQLLADYFSADQLLSLVLGEFVRTPLSGRPELMACVLFRSMRQLAADKQPIKWAVLCLGSFLQMRPLYYSVWALTCLFLSVSTNPVLQVGRGRT
jgi:hypothetical protein